MSKKITLVSSDGKAFLVEEAIALESEIIKNMIESNCADSSIPLRNVTSRILTKVVEYCKKHAESPNRDADELMTWDSEFVKVDRKTLFGLINAANYLNIKGLLDLTCQTAADMIKEKTPAEIRSIFGIENDFTPEEEEAVQRESQWAFQ